VSVVCDEGSGVVAVALEKGSALDFTSSAREKKSGIGFSFFSGHMF